MGPKKVPINEQELNKLVQLYGSANQQIIDEFTGSTGFGRNYRLQILAQIDGILKGLGVDTKNWIDKNVPDQYRAGMKDAVTQLGAVGASLKVGSSMTTINKEAAQALIDSTAKSFGESLTTVSRQSGRIFNDALQQQIRMRIAQGFVSTNDNKKIWDSIKAQIADQGIPSLVDRAGRDWSLDRYAEMLGRTTLVEARNTGLQNKMLENGYDLVEVSSHGATDVCGDWEGEILSLTGATEGYSTVDEATADGLFHPNCTHAINAINLDLASQTNAYNTETGNYE